MLGDISDEEANELIGLFSESVRGNLISRDIVESQIFPVTQYIHVSTYILADGDPSYQYAVLKHVTDKITPEGEPLESYPSSPINKSLLKIIIPAVIGIIVVVAFAAASIKTVEAGHRGILLHFGAVDTAISLDEGLHFVVPFIEGK